MPRGRKPKPIQQRIREGNAGKRPLPAPLELPAGGVVKPVGLPPVASELWDMVVPVLDANGLLNRIDAALTAMCIQWQLAEDARAVLEQEGTVSFGSTGQLVEHPAVATMSRAHATFAKFAEQFGMTTTARARIAVAAHGVMSMREQLQQLGRV